MAKKKSKNTVQDLIGIETFTKRGIKTAHGELVYYLISPTNISVLSKENIEIKIWHLMQVLSAQPNIEISCIDSCERFDDNKNLCLIDWLMSRIQVLGNVLKKTLIILITFKLKCQQLDNL